MDEEIEDDISTRKKDRGQVSKRKSPSLDALDHHARKKERQGRKALKTWVKLA
jgi:dsDNA-specific endonuclease/ATPase MutS2